MAAIFWLANGRILLPGRIFRTYNLGLQVDYFFVDRWLLRDGSSHVGKGEPETNLDLGDRFDDCVGDRYRSFADLLAPTHSGRI